LMQICGVTEEQALALLEACDWQVKTAAAAFYLNSTPDAARAALQAAHGMLREVLRNQLSR